MNNQELQDIIDIEGMEYYILHKNTDWHYLQDKELLKLLYKFEKVSRKIINRLNNNLDK